MITAIYQAQEDQHLTIEYSHNNIKHSFEAIDNNPKRKDSEIRILVSQDGKEAVINNEKLSNELLIIGIGIMLLLAITFLY